MCEECEEEDGSATPLGFFKVMATLVFSIVAVIASIEACLYVKEAYIEPLRLQNVAVQQALLTKEAAVLRQLQSDLEKQK